MIFALLGAVAIGLSLGLLGSGGSILTVPVLIYLAGQPDKVAIAESLAIVGTIAAAGAIPYAFQRQIDWRSVLFFGVPGIVGTYGGAALSKFVPGAVQLALFAVVMLLAAGLMLRGKTVAGNGTRQAAWKIVAEGLVVGVLTGLVGVGGGFLIVPALVLLGGLRMRLAVGTSLLIIAAKSFAGFYKYLDVLAGLGQSVDWPLMATFAVVGIVGSFVGNRVSQRVPQEALRKGFAVFLIVMGVFILWQEAPAAFGVGAPRAGAAVTTLHSPQKPSSNNAMSLFSMFKPSGGPATSFSATEFKARRRPEDAVLDVRTAAEYAEGHVAGAENLDVMAPDFRTRAAGLDKQRTYYLYCRSGNRSGQATAILRENGFEAYNVGGIGALAQAGVEIE